MYLLFSKLKAISFIFSRKNSKRQFSVLFKIKSCTCFILLSQNTCLVACCNLCTALYINSFALFTVYHFSYSSAAISLIEKFNALNAGIFGRTFVFIKHTVSMFFNRTIFYMHRNYLTVNRI